ncbi:acyl transferase [Pedobacter flavus]|uniref:Acyl transferase n=1 Tax=Pedobacter flavus TaxID=3113906 RepID=A0ABU7GXV5_9SPHI|nr:acyl transferase [Pedobacter sp. VNH31]MEE1883878.1 acyl transferase [Pedobacter sp. VNH31]
MHIPLEKVFSINSEEEFNKIALQVFKYQSGNNPVYNSFLKNLSINIDLISNVDEIPYLPISFFKTHEIITPNGANYQQVFLSSATTGSVQSKHFVHNLKLYEKSYLKGFETFYGDIDKYCILALLPSYQERTGSSLIYMVDDLIKKSNHPKSGYFLNNLSHLAQTLDELKKDNQPCILIGVTYALLDLIESQKIDFPNLIIMETGGMKGRRKEMVREELHGQLRMGFNVSAIHSEYGMTELLSQAYSLGNGIFHCTPWMKVSARDVNDPLSRVENGKTGGLNVIDLANLYSCSFIATQDLGRILRNGDFEVLGRFDNSDIRGCNLLVQ